MLRLGNSGEKVWQLLPTLVGTHLRISVGTLFLCIISRIFKERFLNVRATRAKGFCVC